MRINIHAGIEYHEVGLAVTVEIVHHHYGIERLCRVHDELGGVAEPTVILAQPCRRGTYPATPLNGGAARTGGPVDISKLFELEIAQWAEVDLRVAPRLVDDAAWGDNQDADEFMLQPGGIDAITEFWNWINDGAGSGGVGLHGDFNMTGSYDEWERRAGWSSAANASCPTTAASCPASSRPRSGSATSTGSASSGLAAPFEPVRVRLRRVVRAGPEDVRLHRRQRIRDRHRRRGPQHPAHQQRPAQRAHRVPGLQHRLERQPHVLGRPTLARPLTGGPDDRTRGGPTLEHESADDPALLAKGGSVVTNAATAVRIPPRGTPTRRLRHYLD